ncbi:hypothetical protein KL86PLE_41465 [uncultured Pleomorphomonas sp.]|uniref:Uncharacterized protein n=1 Tax=uncultured Pleomorphomonas sp. TaxID=442121 RepID=A0A212LJH6_9HYPH|nr:hypothetical protein KL86PLE_41465 [uncultured Pleomorphomonas sp.]
MKMEDIIIIRCGIANPICEQSRNTEWPTPGFGKGYDFDTITGNKLRLSFWAKDRDVFIGTYLKW